MEALALGLPIVATNVGGISEAVTEGVEGRLVPAERPDELAGAILGLVRDPGERSRMAKASMRRSEQFDVERVVRRYENCYRALVRP
jgi:glycosyltransferase involved in cell wall biosynthesis